MNCCLTEDERIFTSNWSSIRCSFKSLNIRALVYNNNSPCVSPFSPSINLSVLSYFPVSGYKIENTNEQIEDNKAYIDIIIDKQLDLNVILSTENKLIILDIISKQILCSGKIRGYNKYSCTDANVSISLIRNQYKYSDIFTS